MMRARYAKGLFAFSVGVAILGLMAAVAWLIAPPFAGDDSARGMLARRVRAMAPARPVSQAVAIAGGRIVAGCSSWRGLSVEGGLVREDGGAGGVACS